MKKLAAMRIWINKETQNLFLIKSVSKKEVRFRRVNSKGLIAATGGDVPDFSLTPTQFLKRYYFSH